MNSSNPPPGEGLMAQPEDRVVEEMFLALFRKRRWYDLPPPEPQKMMAYPPAQKWALVAQDIATMNKAYPPSKPLSGRVERANAIKTNRSLASPAASQSGGSCVGRRTPIRTPSRSSAASSAGRNSVARRSVADSMRAASGARRSLPRPEDIEQELNAEGLQGDVSMDVGPLTQGIARLHIIEADMNRSLAAGEAEIDRRFNPPSNQSPSEHPNSGDNVATLDELLQSDSLENVFRDNADLRDLITTAEGIREYWATLTEEWREHQITLRAVELNITTMTGWGRDFPVSEYWPGQVAAENDKKDELLEWFGKLRIVLRPLLQRLRNLETEAAALARRPQQRRPVPQAQEFVLFTDLGVHDVTELDWYQDPNRGPRWWLEEALEIMEVRMDKQERLRDTHLDQITNVQNSINDTNNRINDRELRLDRAPADCDTEIIDEYAAVVQGAANDGVFDVDQEIQERSQIIRDRTDAAMARMNRDNDQDQALIRSWNLMALYEDHYQMFAEDFSRRYRTIHSAINDILESLKNGQAPSVGGLNASYRLAWYLHDRESRFRDLYGFLDTSPMRSDLSQYLNIYSQDNVWNSNALQNVAIEELLPICNAEAANLVQFVSTLRIVAPHLGNDAPAFEDNPPNYSPPPQYSLPYVASGSFWTADRIENSKHILHTAFRGPSVSGTYDPTFTWGYQLRAFFGSPDVWRWFGVRTTPFAKKEFLDLVNHMAKYDVPEHVMEAWVHFCTYTQEFFALGPITGKVTVIQKGWDTILENELGGMARKMAPETLARVGRFTEVSHVPLEARDTNWRRWRIEVVEDLFRHCARVGTGFPLTAEIREQSIDWLLEQINWHLEPRERGEPEHRMWELEQYLDNWLVRGVFWMRQDRILVGGDRNIVVRLDSGWGLTPLSDRLMMFVPGLGKPPFVALVMRALGLEPGEFNRLHRRLRGLGRNYLNEIMLYRLWILKEAPPADGAFNISRFLFSSRNQSDPLPGSVVPEDWVVTRGTWHLFLRCLDDDYVGLRVLSMKRNGTIIPHPRDLSYN